VLKTQSAPVTRLSDYRPPAFRIDKTVLDIDLDFDETRVRARHQVRRLQTSAAHLVLDADADMLQVHKISVDGETLAPDRRQMEGGKLLIADVTEAFELAIESTTRPRRNTALSGLYQSGDMLCTQCEAEGFRRISPAIDRPDNLAA